MPGRIAHSEPARKQTIPTIMLSGISSLRKMSAKIGAMIGFRKKMSDASCAEVFSMAIMWQTKPAAELMQQM